LQEAMEEHFAAQCRQICTGKLAIKYFSASCLSELSSQPLYLRPQN